jgi:hypothetical protein
MTNDNPEESLPTPEPAPAPALESALEGTSEPAPEAIAAPEALAAPEPVSEAAAEPVAASPEPVTEAVTQPAEAVAAPPSEEPEESFADLLSAFERSHSHKSEPGAKQLQGTVVSLSAEQVFLDIGYKTEGVLPRSAFENNAEGVKPGDSFPVSVTGRNTEHYYELSRFKVAQPRDWSALEAAFADKTAVVGTVTEVIKGGLRWMWASGPSCPPAAAARATRRSWKSWSAPRSPAASPSSTSPMKTWSSIAAWSSKSRRAASPRLPRGHEGGRHGHGHGPQPHALRRIHRPGRR